MCTQCVEQFFVLLDLGSYMSWINFPNDILVELSTKYSTSQSSPHMTFANLPTEYASDIKVVACCLTICQGEFVVPNSL
jgi:hypothetical protein